MKLRKGIQGRLAGERAVADSPTMGPFPDVAWRRRLHLFTGRALTHTALRKEQEERGGRLALRGQMMSAGVVAGLTVDLDESFGVQRIVVAAGMGVAASGEDVVLPTPLRIAVDDLVVHGHAGRTLRELRDRGTDLPDVMFLVLEPVELDERGDLDGDDCDADPAERDPQSDAFDDRQRVDGVALVLHPWPGGLALPPRGSQWQNRIAWAIFAEEAARGPGRPMPWAETGVPLGVVALGRRRRAEEVVVGEAEASAPDGADERVLRVRIEMLDRAAAVRAGGKPRPRTPLLPGRGTRTLWQARIQQFAEQLAQTSGRPLRFGRIDFRYVPPFGLLSTEAASPRVGRHYFFPTAYDVDAVPVPLEQLDFAVEAAASLAPLDLTVADQVRVLVPVPQAWFEPRLLVVETPDPEFTRTLSRFLAARAERRKRRDDVRAKVDALAAAAHGVPAEGARDADETDPDEAREAEAAPALAPAEEAFDVEDGRAAATKALKADLARRYPRLADDLPKLDAMPLDAFIRDLEQKVRRGDDHVDFGFLRVQADIYRVRQVLLGNTAATRLATSPSLASIVQGETAGAVKENLDAFFRDTRKAKVEEGPAAPFAPPPVGAQPVRALGREGPVAARVGAFVASGGSARASSGETSAIKAGGLGAAGFEATRAKTTAGIIADETSAAGKAVAAGKAARDEILDQNAIAGAGYDFRTVTVAERMKDSSAQEAHSFAVSSKYDALKGFLDGGINLEGVEIPNVVKTSGGETKKDKLSFKDAIGHRALFEDVLTAASPQDGDEAAFVGEGVQVLDDTITVLRGIEGALVPYRAAIEVCKQALARLDASLALATARLRTLEVDLSEARHDVGVARALLAEEEARVAAINTRRDAVLRDHVPFLAFMRRRWTEAIDTAPARPLESGLVEAVLPTCLASSDAAPPEIRGLVALLRRAPIRWFLAGPSIVDKLDRLDLLHGTVQAAKERATLAFTPDVGKLAMAVQTGRFTGAIAAIHAAHEQVVDEHRAHTADVDLGSFAGLAWKASRDKGLSLLSLADLIDTPHGRIDAAQLATRELEDIARVATCLYRAFAEVLPAIRLVWAERFSVYDEHVGLRDLAALPRWSDPSIEHLERVRMQRMVDWLYQRVDAREPRATSIMDDLVRMCVLLASHAPVRELIAAHVLRPTPGKIGATLDLSVDLARARVGMQVQIFQASRAVATGVVEDLGAGRAVARIVTMAHTSVRFDETSEVHLTPATPQPPATRRAPFQK